MAEFTINPVRTYATKQAARKAVARLGLSNVPHTIITAEVTAGDGEILIRYYPLFIGERALSAGAHFHFNVIG
jgi:hypothetical protein